MHSRSVVSVWLALSVMVVSVQASLAQESDSVVAAVAVEERSLERVYRVLGTQTQLDRLGLNHDVVSSDGVHDRGMRAAYVVLNERDLDRAVSLGLRAFEDDEATTLWRSKQPTNALADVAASVASRRGGGIAGFSCYRTVEETYADLMALATANPKLATWVDLADSWEGTREVRALRVTNSASSYDKAPFILIAATHAREYTTAETATRFAEMLVNGFGADAEITAILNTTEIHIVPIHNPDGRKKAEVTPTTFWRKNTNSTNGSCADDDVGVDLNRNSGGLFWQDSNGGFSTNPCSETYSGPSHASEPETVAIDDLMQGAFTDQRGTELGDAAPADAQGLFISLHSYGRLILYPWEHRFTNPPNHDDLRSLGRRMGHHLPGYDACQDCLGSASGTNVDEAYGRYGVAAYTLELGTTFHQSCSSGSTNFEDDIWPQASAALQFSAKAARRPYQEPKGPQVRDVVFGGGPVTAGTSVAISGVADDTVFSEQGDAAVEPTENIVAVYYSIDEPPWTVGLLSSLDPTDGAFNDEVVDPFDGSIDTTGLAPGTHLVYLVAEDASGQKGVATAVFLEIVGVLFADGFESGDTTQWSLSSP